VFGNFAKLEILDLSNNAIEYIIPDTFKNSRRLQSLKLAGNGLLEIEPETFRNLFDVRIVDLSNNSLRLLPDSLFVSYNLEMLDLSYNFLEKIPVGSLTKVAALKLCMLDLSHNNIGINIHSRDLPRNMRVSP
jgi:Leucine-rich repeat (LRR) protein